MKFKEWLGRHAPGMDRASEYFWRVAKETDRVFTRALAREREYICEAARFPSTLYAPCVKGAAPPSLLPEGM